MLRISNLQFTYHFMESKRKILLGVLANERTLKQTILLKIFI